MNNTSFISGDTLNGRTVECKRTLTFYFVDNMVKNMMEIVSEMERVKWFWVDTRFNVNKDSMEYYFYTENLKIKCIHNVYRSKNGTKSCFYIIGVQKKDANDRLTSVQYGVKLVLTNGFFPHYGDKIKIPNNTYSMKVASQIDETALRIKDFKKRIKEEKLKDSLNAEEEKLNFGEKLKYIVEYMDSYERQTKPEMQFKFSHMEPVVSSKVIGVEYKFSLSSVGEYSLDKSIEEKQIIVSKAPIIEEEEMELKGAIVEFDPDKNYLIISFQSTVDFGKFPKAGYINLTAFNVSYAVQAKAIDSLVQGKSINQVLLDIVLYNKYRAIPKIDDKNLNSQGKAVKLAANTTDFLLVQGPPGTGKTTIIIKMIEELIAKGERILISSKNNLAVDNVLQKCIEKNIPCVRLGREESIKIPLVKEVLIDKAAVALQKNIIKSCDKEQLEAIETCENQKLFIEVTSKNLPNIFEYNALLISIKKLSRKLKFKKFQIKALYFYKGLPVLFSKLKAFFTKDSAKANERYTEYIQFIDSKFYSNEKNAALSKELKKTDERKSALKLSIDSSYEEVKGYKNFNYEGLKNEALTKKLEEEELLYKKYDEKKIIIGDWKNSLDERQQSLYPLLLNAVNVVGATTIGVNTNVEFKDVEFDTVIVDEAGQITIFDVLVPISRARKVILIGDHKQLPPVSDETIAAGIADESEESIEEIVPIFKDYKELLGTSLFENLFYSAPADHKIMLDTQFRMHPVISEFISQEFYNNEYRSGLKPSDRELTLSSFKSPLYFIDTYEAEERFENVGIEEEHQVYYNNFEAKTVSEMLMDILTEDNYDPAEIGVITPYKRQKFEIQRLVSEELAKCFDKHEAAAILNNLEIDTVDSFQGRDKNIIIYSFTRSNSEGKIGFLRELRRLNVTMTRAKYLLIMIGDSSTLMKANDNKSRECFKRLVKYVKSNGVYMSVKDR